MKKIRASIFCFITLAMGFYTPANASSFLISNFTLISAQSNILLSTETIIKDWQRAVEKNCLAIAIYHEARGEPVSGQHTVGVTILNRVRSSAYPDTICGVVFQNSHKFNRCQFSFACDRLSDVPKNIPVFEKIKRVANMTLDGKLNREAEFTGASYVGHLEDMTHYHRHDVNPFWSSKLERLSQIGNHIFFKSERVTKRYQKQASSTL